MISTGLITNQYELLSALFWWQRRRRSREPPAVLDLYIYPHTHTHIYPLPLTTHHPTHHQTTTTPHCHRKHSITNEETVAIAATNTPENFCQDFSCPTAFLCSETQVRRSPQGRPGKKPYLMCGCRNVVPSLRASKKRSGAFAAQFGAPKCKTRHPPESP